MRPEDRAKLREDIFEQVAGGATRFGVIGSDEVGHEVIELMSRRSPACTVRWYGDGPTATASGVSRALSTLATDAPEVIVVAEDLSKEAAIRDALPYLKYAPSIIIAGYAHYEFRDDLFEQTLANLHVPSIANGYPNTLIHLYECVRNAARLDLEGAIVEFGVFKGGTTMFLARLAKAFAREWRVIGFDTFGGFPPRRSALDMYAHPGAVFTDFASVERYLEADGVELIRGDIVETANQLGQTPVVVGFVDTDNYSSARAAIEAMRENVVTGGAIVFDHLTGVARFRYTLGERMAARELLADDDRFFNLHGTGVFMKQK
ncbi:MAG: class I SAM-dependent methyltransferase [Microcella sp.]|uniref:TylF/MycF/NovP-related O-methyltransferase n=1 Tax=Microcella sp. TaxID=1913979 RepID=UPI0024C5C840|nr:TylF/MycF/NovP-related O-methyltransferase [Microcella sp.]UYN82918.1 MAG: class I SAM-dependent methyltransferase [Microcella sp.]